MTMDKKQFDVVLDKVGNLELERWVNKTSGHFMLKIPHEKTGSKSLNINDVSMIRTKSFIDVIHCTKYIRSQLGQTLICHCSFQVVLALCAECLHTPKKEVRKINNDGCTYRTSKMYDKRLYDIAHTVFALALILEGIGM